MLTSLSLNKLAQVLEPFLVIPLVLKCIIKLLRLLPRYQAVIKAVEYEYWAFYFLYLFAIVVMVADKLTEERYAFVGHVFD